MKLYEFTVTDEYNLSKSEILGVAERSAAKEAPIREWGEYEVVERQAPERLATGEQRYYFAVEGEYADSADPSNDNKTQSIGRTTRDSAAAPEL